MKRGVKDVDYPALPMGDWAGTISKVLGKGKVIGLGDPDEEPEIDDLYGIFCEARLERHLGILPLCELEVAKGDPNRQAVEDYSSWFWNYQ